MNNQEKNTCAFCRVDKPVLRKYLHAKNKPQVGDGFVFIYYCGECKIKKDPKELDYFAFQTYKIMEEFGFNLSEMASVIIDLREEIEKKDKEIEKLSGESV